MRRSQAARFQNHLGDNRSEESTLGDAKGIEHFPFEFLIPCGITRGSLQMDVNQGDRQSLGQDCLNLNPFCSGRRSLQGCGAFLFAAHQIRQEAATSEQKDKCQDKNGGEPYCPSVSW